MNEFKDNPDSFVKRISQESQEVIHVSNLFLFTSDTTTKKYYYQRLCVSLEKLDRYWAELTTLFDGEEDVPIQSIESEQGTK